jgi:hypothetical protein
MIKRERNSLGSRTLGSECRFPPQSLVSFAACVDVSCADDFFSFFLLFTFWGLVSLAVVFLVVFVVLEMMMVWAYIKVRGPQLYTRDFPR